MSETSQAQTNPFSDIVDKTHLRSLKAVSFDLKKEIKGLVEQIQKWNEDSFILNKVTELLADGFIRTTSDGIIVEFNSAACKLFNTNMPYILGKHINTLILDDWNTLIDGKETYKEHEVVTMLGKKLSVSTSVATAPNGFIFLMRDITEKVKQEQDIRVLSSALDAASDVVIITNKDNRIVFVNKAFSLHTGYSKEEALGKNPNFYRSDLNLPETYAGMWKSLLSKKVWEGTLLNKNKNGSILEDYTVISPLMNGDPDVPAYYIAVKRSMNRMK